VGALLAIMPSAAEATALAVHAHALAGDLAAQELGTESVLPGDVAKRLGRVMRSLKDRPTGY
jgi:NAD(P)H-hydrate repair Nnr-like enzyme with NAD(P)H-hydrate dehydratase domain